MGLYYSQEPSLYHHGIKGQKWGVRRFQNPDGSLTAAGKRRQYKQEYKQAKKDVKLAQTSGALLTKKKYRNEVIDKVDNEIRINKPIQKYVNNLEAVMLMVNQAAKNAGIDPSRVRLDPSTSRWLLNQKEEAEKERDRIVNDYVNEYSKAFLKDIGSQDTQGGRDYVNKYLQKHSNLRLGG